MASCNSSSPMDATGDENVFRDALKAMMFFFGDVKEPIEESVTIVYKVLREEMNVLLFEAEKVAHFRKSKVISHEEMLFLMRKHKGKLKRLYKFLQVMDESPELAKTAFCFSSVLEKDPKKRRAEKCIEFLAFIEDCGEYTSILNDPAIIDVDYRNMLQRRNTMTQWMDSKEYIEYTKQILEKSFCAKQKFNDFEKWLLEDSAIEMNLTALAFEIIRFLARETVSKIVDLALIIKSKKNNKLKSPEIRLRPFNFFEVAKECNAVELCPSPSIADKTASNNTDHSYFANKDSNDSPFFNFHGVRRSTKNTVDGVDKLHKYEDQPMDESDSNKQHNINSDNSAPQANAILLPSWEDRREIVLECSHQLSSKIDAGLEGNSTHSSNNMTLRGDITRKSYQEPLENRSHPQEAITPAEVIQVVAMYHQHSWSNDFLDERMPMIKLLCLDQHVSVRI